MDGIDCLVLKAFVATVASLTYRNYLLLSHSQNPVAELSIYHHKLIRMQEDTR